MSRKPSLRVVAKKAQEAIHILDRFHIMGYMSKAIDEVRAQEVWELKAKGYEPVLKHARWGSCSSAPRTSPGAKKPGSPSS